MKTKLKRKVAAEEVAEDIEIKKTKKKKSVKFDAAIEKPSSSTKTVKKTNVQQLTKEVENEKADDKEEGDQPKSKKRNRHKNRKSANNAKRQKLVDGVLGPKIETVDFTSEQKQFSEFDLDERILKSIGEMGWKYPTQVQESVIALALEDKNIMARARTGSGKTAAFLLPILNKVVQHVSAAPGSTGPFALFIAPTKELATQIFKLLGKLLAPLPFLQALNLSDLSEDERTIWEKDSPSIVVSTPGKMVEMVKLRPEFCQQVRHLVLDEADLLLSFGYEDEMATLKERLPEHYQCIFTSATLTDDMTLLKKLFMTGPVVTIKLKEGDLPDADQLSQYHITCLDDEQRFAIMVAMLKLKLIVGKTIIFVNTTDRCYKLSLILRTFGLKSCILNSEMPANSRCHVIDQFNNGLFSIIIASDAQDAVGALEEDAPAAAAQKTKKSHRDKEAGVARGIDFHHVANVVNCDFPTSTDVYIHRVGRTARGWNKGTALSFCSAEERPYLDLIQEEVNKQMNRKVLMPYEIRIKELDSFLLRTREALLKCTKGAVKYARMREIKLELMRSAKLQGYFASNPREKDLMSTSEHPVTLRLHSAAIADVPDYMVPQALRGMDFSSGRSKRTKLGQRNRKKILSANQKKHQKDQKNPLKSFKAK